MSYITIKGARQHNLKNISLQIPKDQLVVFTGLSGSGKSSLAFDTIYAEGQRRYVESLSSYARQFLGIMNKPDVDSIEGLSPAISIDQKTTSHNPRSTVGTITEIYDYLRLLFARVGHPHCPHCGREITKQSVDQIVSSVLELIDSSLNQHPILRFAVLAPIVRDKKGEFSGLLDNLRQKGFSYARIDQQFHDLSDDLFLIKTNKHSISAIVERISVDRKSIKSEIYLSQLKSRLTSALETSLNLSNGLVIITLIHDSDFEFPAHPTKTQDHLYSEQFACPECNLSLPEIEPRIFSFNSPHGACTTCHGLGSLLKIDPEKVIAPEISLSEGAVIPFASTLTHDSWFARVVKTVVDKYGESIQTPYHQLSAKLRQVLMYGDDPSVVYTVFGPNRFGRETSFDTTFEGFINNLERRYQETKSEFMRHEIERFMKKTICPHCHGDRLRSESLAITIDKLNIAQLTQLSISHTLTWVRSLTSSVFSSKEQEIANLIVKELESRLQFLVSVGLDYLTLNREAASLAGGEAQRIRLASQIGTGLTGVLYILDEPTIGLHPRDNQRLLSTLKKLRDLGNSVIVVEHDAETILQSDYVFDFGPEAGRYGGTIVFSGTPDMLKKEPKSLTGLYLSHKKQVESKIKISPKSVSRGVLKILGCNLHNLKNIQVDFPLSQMICITGVSGSGKSTLMHDTLYHALKTSLSSNQPTSPHYTEIQGVDQISRVSLIDQSPIGKTPRSNPATYTKAFDLIRTIFASTREAHMKGYKSGRFSFNVKGGRCEACQGEGQVKIEMQFLPDIYVTCEVCSGNRYNSETLEVRYKGKNISDVLHLTVKEAVDFFHSHSGLSRKLKTLNEVGLGYLELGQPAPTLSGGEAQRVKLAKELSINSTGHTVYLLDEPTTGLHFEDANKLLSVLFQLVSQNNTVIVIEHNLDIIKNAHHIIDLGPEGGDGGGEVVVTGSPAQVAQNHQSYTGKYLKSLLSSTP